MDATTKDLLELGKVVFGGGQYDLYYKGHASIGEAPLKFPFFPWQNLTKVPHAYVNDSTIGIVGIPLTTENPDPETGRNLASIVDQIQSGRDVSIDGRAIISSEKQTVLSYIAESAKLWWGIMKLDFKAAFKQPDVHRQVYSGTISIDGEPKFQYWVDLSPNPIGSGIRGIPNRQ